MIRLYFFLFLLLLTQGAEAQGLPGFVITTAGDTLRGDVAEKAGQRILFDPGAGQPVQYYRPGQLRGYGLRGHAPILSRVVRLASGADSARFVLLQDAGPASLYSFANDRGLLLGTAAADTLHELTALNWHLVLNRYLRACPTFRHTDPELLALPFSEADLRRVLIQYNTCAEPGWLPTSRMNYSGWRKVIGVRVGAMRAGATGYLDRESYVQSREIGVEWGGVRASGLQSGVQLGYTNMRFLEPVTQVRALNQTLLDEQQETHSHLITATLSLGKRFGRVRRPNFYAGGGLGILVNALTTNTTRQRPAGSTTAFSVVGTSEDSGGAVVYGNVVLGVILPLAARQEIRLNAVYQRFLVTNINFLGAQLAYYWLLK